MSSERNYPCSAEHTAYRVGKVVKSGIRTAVVAGSLMYPPSIDASSSMHYEDFSNNSSTIVRELPSSTETCVVTNEKYIAHGTRKVTTSKDRAFHELLENTYIRSAIVAGLAYSVAGGVNAHLLGKKYDEDFLYKLRVAAPMLATAGFASLGVDSVTMIDRYIPASLLLGASLCQAAFTILATTERHRDPKIRATTVAASLAMVAVAASIFASIHEM